MKNVAESKQSSVVADLLIKYKPDILVITGHDGMIKRELNIMIYTIIEILDTL